MIAKKITLLAVAIEICLPYIQSYKMRLSCTQGTLFVMPHILNTYHFCYDAFLQLVEPKVRLHAKPFEENEAENERQ